MTRLLYILLIMKSVLSLNWSISNVVLPYGLQGAVASVHNNYISILGGYYMYGGMIINDKVYKYPINTILLSTQSTVNHNNTIKWTNITAPLILGGQQSQFVVFDDIIYIYTKQLNIYNLKSDSFTDTSNYQQTSIIDFNSAGSCIIGIIDKKNEKYIFITGGYYGNDHTQSITNTQIYNINKDKWLLSVIYSMNIARGYHTCVY
eukprot:385860_1